MSTQFEKKSRKVKMKTEEAVAFYGGVKKLADALGKESTANRNNTEDDGA